MTMTSSISLRKMSSRELKGATYYSKKVNRPVPYPFAVKREEKKTRIRF
jgi:hypothetical protein